MNIIRFEDLEIWQLARELCKEVIRLTSSKPFCNDYRFRDQIRASSGSIMDNIAEGFITSLIKHLKSSAINGPKYKIT